MTTRKVALMMAVLGIVAAALLVLWLSSGTNLALADGYHYIGNFSENAYGCSPWLEWNGANVAYGQCAPVIVSHVDPVDWISKWHSFYHNRANVMHTAIHCSGGGSEGCWYGWKIKVRVRHQASGQIYSTWINPSGAGGEGFKQADFASGSSTPTGNYDAIILEFHQDTQSVTEEFGDFRLWEGQFPTPTHRPPPPTNTPSR